MASKRLNLFSHTNCLHVNLPVNSGSSMTNTLPGVPGLTSLLPSNEPRRNRSPNVRIAASYFVSFESPSSISAVGLGDIGGVSTAVGIDEVLEIEIDGAIDMLPVPVNVPLVDVPLILSVGVPTVALLVDDVVLVPLVDINDMRGANEIAPGVALLLGVNRRVAAGGVDAALVDGVAVRLIRGANVRVGVGAGDDSAIVGGVGVNVIACAWGWGAVDEVGRLNDTDLRNSPPLAGGVNVDSLPFDDDDTAAGEVGATGNEAPPLLNIPRG
jgi:hypothetical protein